MKLRHLRYFIAVAEEGSITNAAERRLQTAQPSLSRQIRDLELEIGVKLLERKAPGWVFLDHARLGRVQLTRKPSDQKRSGECFRDLRNERSSEVDSGA